MLTKHDCTYDVLMFHNAKIDGLLWKGLDVLAEDTAHEEFEGYGTHTNRERNLKVY